MKKMRGKICTRDHLLEVNTGIRKMSDPEAARLLECIGNTFLHIPPLCDTRPLISGKPWLHSS
jgi:hypothetical protein